MKLRGVVTSKLKNLDVSAEKSGSYWGHAGIGKWAWPAWNQCIPETAANTGLAASVWCARTKTINVSVWRRHWAPTDVNRAVGCRFLQLLVSDICSLQTSGHCQCQRHADYKKLCWFSHMEQSVSHSLNCITVSLMFAERVKTSFDWLDWARFNIPPNTL